MAPHLVNGKQLLITRERLIRGRVGLVLIAIVTIQYALFLIPLSLVLLPIPFVWARRLYRRWISTVQLVLLGFLGYVLEFVCQIRLVITGADELLHVLPAKPLILSNHRCELDWLFLVCLSLRLHRLSGLKIATWEEYAQIPFIGWLIQAFVFPAICGRDKVKDLATLRNTVDYLTAIQHPLGVTMALFPEGAAITSEKAIEKSHRYAELIGIDALWKNVLIPRTPGVYETVRSLNRLNSIDSVIDVTIGYLDFSPFETSSLVSFWTGTYPREVHMHLNHTRWVDIPTDFDSMRHWLIERFAAKERLIEKFYQPLDIMYRTTSTESSSSSSLNPSSPTNDNDEDDENLSSDQFSTTSTHLSNLATLVAFSEDCDSPEPAEETLSKDMRFIQYISNSYVISAVVAMMVLSMVVSMIIAYPRETLLYVLGVCVVMSFITRWIGGLNVLELELMPVQVDLTYNAEFYAGADGDGYKASGVWASIKEMFGSGKGTEAEFGPRDKENYVQTIRKRRALAAAPTQQL